MVAPRRRAALAFARIDLIALLERSRPTVLRPPHRPLVGVPRRGLRRDLVRAGSTDDRALQTILKEMCCSRFARDLVRAAISVEATPAPVSAVTSRPTGSLRERRRLPAAPPPPRPRRARAHRGPRAAQRRPRERRGAPPPAPAALQGAAGVRLEDRATAQKLGDLLDATVICCDRGDSQQVRSHVKKLRVYDAVLVHTTTAISESRFAMPAACGKDPARPRARPPPQGLRRRARGSARPG